MSETRLSDGLPPDVVMALAWAGLAVVTGLFGGSLPPLVRLPVLVGFTFVVPGYLTTLALFPRDGSISGLARAVLAVAASPVAVVLIGLVLDRAWRIDAVTMTLGIAAVSALLAVLAEYRRRRQPGAKRAHPLSTAVEWGGTVGRRVVLRGDWRRSTLLPVASSALVLVLAVALVVGTPAPGEQFTEFYVLGPDGTVDGLTVGSGNATERPPEVSLWIRNHEHESGTYGVQMQAIRAESGDVTVVRTVEDVTLAHGDRWNTSFDVARLGGEGYARVEFLLFRGATPGDPMRPDDAYRSVDLKV